MAEEQLSLNLGDEDLDTRIYVEDLTINADRVLAQAIGKYENVFLIGVGKEGASYYSNYHDVAFWCLLLERARNFIMENS